MEISGSKAFIGSYSKGPSLNLQENRSYQANPSCIGTERFKTREAHFPIWSNQRTGMQRATVGKSGCEVASQS